MRTPEDDLKVGQWIAIVSEVAAEPATDPWTGMQRHVDPQPHVDGRPLQILEMKVIRLNRQYVDKMQRSAVRQAARQQPTHGIPYWIGGLDTGSGASRYSVVEPKKMVYESPERACPLCGQRLIERCRDAIWYLACRDCGFEGGRPGDRND